MKLAITKTINQGGAYIYKIVPTNIILGNQDTHNTADIEFELPEEWQGLTVRATFNPGFAEPIELLIFDGKLQLKSDITSESGVLVVDAFNDDVHYYTTDCQYSVAKHAPVGGSEPEYSPSEVEQILAQVQIYANKAENAKQKSISASENAERVKTEILEEKAGFERFVNESAQRISQQTEYAVNALEDKGNEKTQEISVLSDAAKAEIGGLTDTSKADLETQINAGKADIAAQINAGKAEIAAQINTGKTDINNLASLKKQEIADAAQNQIDKINADDMVQKVRALEDKKISKFYANNLGAITLNDSDNGKIQDMVLYGKCEQDGTPTPENPVEINSVVNPKVTVCGKNLFDVNGETAIISASATISDNKITIKINNDWGGQYAIWSAKYPSGTYTIKASLKKNGTAQPFRFLCDKNFTCNDNRVFFNDYYNAYFPHAVTTIGGAYTFTVNEPFSLGFIFNCGGIKIGDTMEISEIQVEKGEVATDYEAYKEQTISIPYTLNGIPVSSGGNYTNENGQQYIADYVDFSNKKLHRLVDNSLFNTSVSIVDNTDLLLSSEEVADLTDEEVQAFKDLATYFPTSNVFVTSDQIDGYTTFNYPISMANGWNYIKQQLGDTREYIYDMDLMSAQALVNSEYAVALTELGV